MCLGERGDVEIEDELAVVRDEWLVGAVGIQQLQRVLQPAARAEDVLLVDVRDARSEASAVTDLVLNDVGLVVRVDHDVANAVCDEVRDSVGQDRNTAHGQHRLRALGPHPSETRRESGAEQHRAHASTVARASTRGQRTACARQRPR
jgi:hypothetical protein